jgi:F0F1-type ATP synthase assembly protein I
MDEKPAKNSQISKMEALGFVWEVFASVAVPTTALALFGRFLDKRWDLNPLFTIVGLALALAISGWLVYRKAQAFSSRMKSS